MFTDRPVMRIGTPGHHLNITLREGEKLIIPCEVSHSKPLANYTEWRLDGKLINTTIKGGQSAQKYRVADFPWINLDIHGVDR